MKVLSHVTYFASNFFIRSAHKILGELNSIHAWQFLTTSILPVLKSFMKNLLTIITGRCLTLMFCLAAHDRRSFQWPQNGALPPMT